jgi:Carboxypeptidase regulatory-like domain
MSSPVWFSLFVAAAMPLHGQTAKTLVCYGRPGARQGDCTETQEGAIMPPPERAGQTIAVVEAGAIVLDVVTDRTIKMGIARETLVRVPLETVIDDSRSAGAVTLTLGDSGDDRPKWSFALPAARLSAVHAVFLPHGQYRIGASAEHYAPASVRLDASGTRAPRAQIVLRRMPSIAGRVVTWTGEPAVDAVIQPQPGNGNCRTGALGEFQCEITGEWPIAVVITYAGAGTKTIPIDREARDKSLGDIRLNRGARLIVHISAPPNVSHASLSLLKDGRGPSVEVTARAVSLPSAPVVLAGLDPGDYRLLIRSDQALQQMAMTVRVGEGDTQQSVAVHEAQLALRVLSNGRAEGGAAVTLKNLEGRWSGTVSVSDDGTATEPLWQSGEFTASVMAKGSSTPLYDHRTLGDEDKLQLSFDLPAARIEGRVVDDAGSPVPAAIVHLGTDDGDMQSQMRTSTDSNGRYGFDHVRIGNQSLSASAETYLPSDETTFALSANDAGRSVDLKLKRGSALHVAVVDQRGVPLPNAEIFETADSALLTVMRTSSAGEADLSVPAAGSAVLIVAPVTGSFAIRRVGSADREAGSVRISVPDPAASLELRTETIEHASVRGVHFLVRYDGETIPYDVLMHFAQLLNLRFETGDQGTGLISNLPPGLYELWPYAKMMSTATQLSPRLAS